MNTVKIGDKGTTVAQLQLALNRAGYLPQQPDGVFGLQTKKALMLYQSSHALYSDGIAGARTWKKLVAYLKGYTVYIVRKSDTLWKISQQFSTSLRAVITANPSLNPENLSVGAKVFVPFSFPLVPDNVSISSELCGYIAEGLAVRYPFLETDSVGKSVMGRSLTVLKIGRGKKEVFFNAAHHANEWLTSYVVLKFAEDYLCAVSQSAAIDYVDAVSLFNSFSLYIMPMVNPDGVDLVTGILNRGEYYENAVKISEAYPSIKFASGWKANIIGTDLNLQYPAGWDNAKEIKYSQGYISPAPRDYVGVSPLSAPESRAVYEFTLKHNFLLTLSYHSQGNIIYWKYLDYEPTNSKKIAEYFASVSGYAVEETPKASGYAGYKDWFIENYNLPGYTIEIGTGESPLPLSQFPKIYSDNIGIMLGAMTQSEE